MKTTPTIRLAAGLAIGLGLASSGAVAQSTDGYHTIQIFPVVVDTASFTQRFNFRNPNDATISVTPKYYPGTGTSQAPTALTCPAFNIAAGKHRYLPDPARRSAPASPQAASSASSTRANYPLRTFPTPASPAWRIRRATVSPSRPSRRTPSLRPTASSTASVAVPPAVATRRSRPTASSATSTTSRRAPRPCPRRSLTRCTAMRPPSIGSASLSLAPGQFVRLLDVFAIARPGRLRRRAAQDRGDQRDRGARPDELLHRAGQHQLRRGLPHRQAGNGRRRPRSRAT